MPRVYARQICEPALRLIGVAASEQPISADMADAALDALNTMLDSWSVERLLTWTRPTISLTLVPGRGIYTWGVSTPACDIAREPPVRLEMCTLVVEATPPYLEWPLRILDQEAYKLHIEQKGLASAYPEIVYLEDQQPVAAVCVWPVPSQAFTLHLLPWQAHSPYEHWDHALDWPNGYMRPMQYNLAVELAPQYGVEASPTVMRIADEAKRVLYPINLEMGHLRLNPRQRVGASRIGHNPDFLAGR